jgi:hypothetical protein
MEGDRGHAETGGERLDGPIFSARAGNQTELNMWIKRILIACMLTMAAASAAALERPFPQTAKRGTMSPSPHPTILIDGEMRRMTAGGRIWNQNNLIQMPATVAPGTYTINYTETLQGEIDRIWILTPQEAEKAAPAPRR